MMELLSKETGEQVRQLEKDIVQAGDTYAPPPPPFDESALFGGSFAFGKEARRWFLLDLKWTYLNHGAFGAAALPGLQAMRLWQDHCERQPAAVLSRGEVFSHVARVLREVAGFVGSRPQDLVSVSCSAAGVTAVARSAHVKAGDVVFALSDASLATRKCLASVSAAAGAHLYLHQVKYPLGKDEEEGAAALVRLLEENLPQECRLCVLDMVSAAGVKMPIEEMVAVCRKKGVRVLVDGSNALGVLPVDLAALGADFFVAECHLWLCSPRSCGLLWVSPALKHTIQPLVVAEGHGEGFTSEFTGDGGRDLSALLAVSTALRFWRFMGVDAARAHISGLMAQAVGLLVSAWKTGLLAPLEMSGPGMTMVRLPRGCWAAGEATATHAEAVQTRLIAANVEAPVLCVQGELYVRLSVHVYNCPEDFHRLASAVARMAASAELSGGECVVQ